MLMVATPRRATEEMAKATKKDWNGVDHQTEGRHTFFSSFFFS
jgi:hypothetical protein